MLNINLLSFLFIAFDIIVGFIGSIKNKTFKSSIMREGMFHKVGSILIILLGDLIAYSSNFFNIGYGKEISSCICIYIVIMEVGSILENLGKLNPELQKNVISKIFTEDGKNESK